MATRSISRAAFAFLTFLIFYDIILKKGFFRVPINLTFLKYYDIINGEVYYIYKKIFVVTANDYLSDKGL